VLPPISIEGEGYFERREAKAPALVAQAAHAGPGAVT
jgi:hypothetical protein